jgi:hypothetical protein
MKSRAIFVAGLTVCALYIGTRPAEAYIDPGSTNMALQWVVGGAAAGVVLLSTVWRRLVARMRRVFRSDGL